MHTGADPTPGATPPLGLWNNIVASLRGQHLDYTSGPLPPAIWALAVPMVIEMLMESIFVVVDVFYVG